MTNTANFGTLTGRLSQPIKEFSNADGSRKQLITLAVDDNFRSGSRREIATNFIQLENFIPAQSKTSAWDNVHPGDLIQIMFRVEAKSYTDSHGRTHYPQKLIVQGFPNYLESKTVTEARRVSKQATQSSETGVSTPVPAVSSRQEESITERISKLEAEISTLRNTPFPIPEEFAAEIRDSTGDATPDYDAETPYKS